MWIQRCSSLAATERSPTLTGFDSPVGRSSLGPASLQAAAAQVATVRPSSVAFTALRPYLLDLTVAFPARRIDEPRIHLALAALAAYPEPAWEVVGKLGGETLGDEVGFRLFGNPIQR